MLDIFDSIIKRHLKTADVTERKSSTVTYRKKKYIYTCVRCKKKITTTHFLFIDTINPFDGSLKSISEGGGVINNILEIFKNRILVHDKECQERDYKMERR